MSEVKRKIGIPIVGDASWGTHFCQFYQTKEDLIEILVPYFKMGLENNEYCMWIVSEPLLENEITEIMETAVPNFDHYVNKGQIEIFHYSQWYLKNGYFNSEAVLNGWIDKLNYALTKGYDGLRLSGNTFWLEEKDWDDFADYEREINRVIGKYRMLAICTYYLNKCAATDIIDVVQNHQFALIRKNNMWTILKSSERMEVEKVLKRSEKLEQRVRERTQELERTQKELIHKEKLAAVGQMASSVGHELRNPLGVIGNSAYYLNMKLKDADEKVKKHLGILQREVEQSNRIITDLLDFSRTASLSLERFQLNSIIRSSLDSISIPDNLTVEKRLNEELPKILIDPVQIEQVFRRILINAVEAMPTGGKLEIRTGVAGNFAEIIFKDTGEGIDKEILQDIFDPLYTTKMKRIGLGLTIAKSIVDMHKGRVEVKSKPGKGSTFTVKLPLNREKKK